MDVKRCDLKVCTLNVRGMRSKVKRRRLFQWFKEKQFDIILLQETYCTLDFVNTFNRDWPGAVYHSVSTSAHSSGVAILLSTRFRGSVNLVYTCERTLILNINIDDKPISIICAYAPNDARARKTFLKNLADYTNKYCPNTPTDSIIIGGDFNTVDVETDRKSKNLDGTSKQFT